MRFVARLQTWLICLKGIFNPLRLVCVQIVQQYAVKTTGALGLFGVTHEITACRMNNALLFASVDAGSGATEARVSPESYFNKYQGVAIERNAVDFAASYPVVAHQNTQACTFQIGAGEIFGRIAGHLLGRERGILVWHPHLQSRRFI